MDTVPSSDIDAKVRSIAAKVSDIRRIDEVHAHRFGPYLVLNITIGVNGALSVARGNEIAHSLENELKNHIDMLRKVYIHYHPG
jgi:divalent metal cation (Fe/Co/Zn/Cd) transporter